MQPHFLLIVALSLFETAQFEGCEDPEATAAMLRKVGEREWDRWDSSAAFSLWPDAVVSTDGEADEIITLARTGRLIGGMVQCEEALIFEEEDPAGQEANWRLDRVIVVYSAGAILEIDRARDLFLAAIPIPKTAAVAHETEDPGSETTQSFAWMATGRARTVVVVRELGAQPKLRVVWRVH